MKNSINDIIDLLNGISGISFVEADKGQLNKEITELAPTLPGILVDIDNISFSNLANDLSQIPVVRQMGSYEFVIRVAENATTTASFDIWTAVEEIHTRLQGVCLADDFSKLLRVNLERIERDDTIRVYEILYTCEVQDI